MTSRVVPDDDEQIIADLIKQVRQLGSRVTTTNVRGYHDEFTAAATPATSYTLTYIPVDGTCQMSLNRGGLGGVVLEEGVDYSCDYGTGIVTVSIAQSAGDKLSFRYLITDLLVAASLPAELLSFSDDFNRADSATTLGTPWATLGTGNTTDNGWNDSTWGIDSDTARMQHTVTDGMGSFGSGAAYIDGQSGDGQLDLDISTLGLDIFGDEDIASFRIDPIGDGTLGGRSLFIVGISQLIWLGAHSFGSPISPPFSSTFAAGDHLTVVLAGTSITVKRNGSTVGSYSIGDNLTATHHGLGGASAASKLDNFSWTSA